MQSFVRDVRASGDFMRQQDAASADARHAQLLSQLAQARELLRWNPEAGRPARLLQSQAFQGRAIVERALTLADTLGLPNLRELIVKPYVLLYAHGSDCVVVLALKHKRQLAF
ncbi:MAG TPA: type II toxin-antitoxin system RelE/ParE family toxin, partial [Roseateles sp.]